MRKQVLVLVLLLFSISSFADDVTFTAQAPEAVANGQQFRLSYTVNTQKVKDFRGPAVNNFSVLSGPNRSSSSSTQFINGSVTSTSTITYTYILMATQEGEFTIPAATITAGSEQKKSNEVTIKVLPADKNAQNGGATSRGGASQASSSGTKISNEDLFIRTIVNKTKVYEQEAILLTYKVYALVNLTSLQGKMPDLKGFHVQEIELPRNKTWQLEHYNGRNYKTITWSQYVLFPQQSGELEIPSITFDGIVAQQVQRNIDPFELFFNGGSSYVDVKKPLTTPKAVIQVEPLPTGKPVNYSGAVGDFSISSSITANELKTNEAVTLKLIISGTGNMKLIKTPEVEFPKDFEIYDPKIDNKYSLKSDGLSGSKVIEYLAIPRYAGTYTIPPVTFSYFDIKTKKYNTLQTQEYTLNVAKGDGSEGGQGGVASYIGKEDLRLLGQDIRYIKLTEESLSERGNLFFASITYYLWYVVPFILFVLFVIIWRKQAIENANVAKVKTKKANKVAVRRMRAAKKLMEANKESEFYDEVLRTLWGYISDKLNIPVSRLSKDNIAAELRAIGVSDALIQEFEQTLNDCEFARYAPGSTGNNMSKSYDAAINVISKMDNNIKR